MSSLLPEGAGIIVGVGVGAAASAAIEPAVEIPKQEAWQRNPNKVLPADLMARLVAQGGITLEQGEASAKREGFHEDKFDKLVYLAQTVPGIGEAVALWRLGLLPDDLFLHVLTKMGLDTRYVEPIVKRKTAEVLGIGDIAYGVVRGILPAPDWMPVAPPTSGDKVKRFPQVDIDPLTLAHKLGYDEDMLRLAVGRSGLSMAPVMAANARFRNIIGPNDYLLAIAEGDLRTEWADAVLDASRQILTAGEYAELQLRGYYDRATRLTNTRKHGMSDEDSDLLYDVQGRGLNLHQAFIAERRGGEFNGPTDQIPEWAMFQLQRGNLRPEVYNLAWAGRESYPSAFVFRALLTDKVLTAEQGESYYLKLGWPQELAHLTAQHYGAAAGASTDPHVVKAQTQLWNTLHRSYLAGESSEAEVTAALPRAGVAAGSVADVLATWDEERAIIRKQLSPAQVKKAFREAVLNPDTGQGWTKDEATAALVARGYSTADATTFLEL